MPLPALQKHQPHIPIKAVVSTSFTAFLSMCLGSLPISQDRGLVLTPFL